MSLFLGLDLGGTKMDALALRPGFHDAAPGSIPIAARARIPTEAWGGYEHILKRAEGLLKRVFEEGGGRPSQGERPLGVGVGAPGHVSRVTGGLKNANTRCLIGQDLKGDLLRALGCEVALENDANLFTLAEATWGAGRGAEVAFGVILGTGVGGGISIGGRVIPGAQGIAGEWGHNRLHPGGRACYCGRRGCVEAYLSGVGLKKSLEEGGISMSAEAFTQAIDDGLGEGVGSEAAGLRAVADAYVSDLGRALGVVVNILDPEVIILGGGVGQWRWLYEAGPEALRPHVFNDECRTQLRPPTLGDAAGVFGAALLGYQRRGR